MPSIIFYGPMGNNIPKERIGGAESGCRRSVDLLKSEGYCVDIVEKPTMYYGVFPFVKEYWKAVKKIWKLMSRDQKQLLYITGFYGRQLPLEFFLGWMSSVKKIKYIYEPKNGAMVWKYEKSGKLYRWISRWIFSHAAAIFCQGIEYQNFLKKLGYQHVYYHPNYVSESVLAKVEDHRSSDLVLGYMGRVSESKNIEVVLSIFQGVHMRYPDSKLLIIGGYEEEYGEKLKKQVVNYGLEECVTFTGRLDFDEISFWLNQMHFFLFPSKEKFEGHSNALTEAMAFGVVPLVSNIGFNASVVGLPELVIPSYDAKAYICAAEAIWSSGRWMVYSDYVKNRVRKLYSEQVVREEYLNIVSKI